MGMKIIDFFAVWFMRGVAIFLGSTVVFLICKMVVAITILPYGYFVAVGIVVIPVLIPLAIAHCIKNDIEIIS